MLHLKKFVIVLSTLMSTQVFAMGSKLPTAADSISLEPVSTNIKSSFLLQTTEGEKFSVNNQDSIVLFGVRAYQDSDGGKIELSFVSNKKSSSIKTVVFNMPVAFVSPQDLFTQLISDMSSHSSLTSSYEEAYKLKHIYSLPDSSGQGFGITFSPTENSVSTKDGKVLASSTTCNYTETIKECRSGSNDCREYTITKPGHQSSPETTTVVSVYHYNMKIYNKNKNLVLVSKVNLSDAANDTPDYGTCIPD